MLAERMLGGVDGGHQRLTLWQAAGKVGHLIAFGQSCRNQLKSERKRLHDAWINIDSEQDKAGRPQGTEPNIFEFGTGRQ